MEIQAHIHDQYVTMWMETHIMHPKWQHACMLNHHVAADPYTAPPSDYWHGCCTTTWLRTHILHHPVTTGMDAEPPRGCGCIYCTTQWQHACMLNHHMAADAYTAPPSEYMHIHLLVLNYKLTTGRYKTTGMYTVKPTDYMYTEPPSHCNHLSWIPCYLRHVSWTTQ
jgi:hypothetical protein